MPRKNETETRDWQVTRTRQQHFTDDERAFIRECFHKKYPPNYVARRLKCSVRSIDAHYRRIREGT